jgi:hypothetical protein
MKCPSCSKDMQPGFMYVRGLGGSLFWSETKDTRSFSRRGLEQIDLSRLSLTSTAAQAVFSAARCRPCSLIAFKA